MRPRTLKQAVEQVQAGEDERLPVDEFLDEFFMAIQEQDGQPDPQGMIDEEPPLLGRQPFDAYIGAVGEHLARRWDLSIPGWTDNPYRFLHEPWFPGDLELLKPLLLRDSPSAFRRRLIFTEAEPLRRGRFPRQEQARNRTS